MRRTMSSQSPPAQRGASSIISPHSLSLSISISSGGAMSPVSTASFTLAALLLLTTPVCHKGFIYRFFEFHFMPAHYTFDFVVLARNATLILRPLIRRVYGVCDGNLSFN
ncbi:hypothetical protein F2P81_005939 [Scophthalmus maximus]|uniref:Uncharacterized protein n=1 Tax=Scophthalmus maximus TaxID=52904 RepID=A0A6A4T7W8_SCOMX|nr:hypothetical protein F2P81_005939 [Scophthalmus maximus]